MAHKKIDFTKPGGFPFSQDVLKFMQEGSLDELNALARIVGDNTILFGCVVSGQKISNGWMVVGQQLVPFNGGSFTGSIDSVKIGTGNSDTSLSYEDGTVKPAMRAQYAHISTNNGILFKDFKRLDTISDLVTKANEALVSTEVHGPILFGLENDFTEAQKLLDTNTSVLEKTLSPQGSAWSNTRLKAYSLVLKKINKNWIRIDGVLMIRRPTFAGTSPGALPNGLKPEESIHAYKDGSVWYIDVQINNFILTLDSSFRNSFNSVAEMSCSTYYPLPLHIDEAGTGSGGVPGLTGHNEFKYAHNYKTLHVPVRLRIKSQSDNKLIFRFSLLENTVEFFNHQFGNGYTAIHAGDVATIPIHSFFKLAQ